MTKYVKIKEFLELVPFQISAQWLRKLIKANKIKSIRLSPRGNIYIPITEVERIQKIIDEPDNE